MGMEDKAILPPGGLFAAYGTNRDATIEGDSVMKPGEDIRPDIYISGGKPLGTD